MNILLIGGNGYIGSYLNFYLKKKGYKVDICDQYPMNKSSVCIYPFSYTGITSKDLAKYNAVLWFAGHSSVSQSNADPIGALNNNMVNLIDFLKKLPNENILFIYASTASLYSGLRGPVKEDMQILPYENSYDISKFSFDYLAKRFHSKIIGLRMGTLAGFSPNLRPELIFNSMVLNAYLNNEVKVANKKKIRSILFLSDLAEIVNLFLTSKKISPGHYNCASFTFSIDELGEKIANYFGAKVKYLPDSPTYSFSVDTLKIKKMGFRKTFTFNEQIKNFINDVKKYNYNTK